jgi:pyruvate/2-oxoglutarate dehydrogenase complex dihydrolipoamide acyltransferase (E2) component
MFVPVPRSVVLVLVAVLSLVSLVDGGSVVLTRMAVPDEARQAGYAAADAVADEQATPQTVRIAFEAARKDARDRNIAISTKSFTLYADGRVTLTAHRTAPTLLLHRISALNHLAEVRDTVTVAPLPLS